MKGTQLAFRTPIGGLEIPTGATITLTEDLTKGVPVKAYSSIRVACDNRRVSSSAVTFLLIINQRGELLVELDTITLQPGTSFTQTYDIPGIGLSIDARTETGVGTDVIDFLLYGYSPSVIIEDGCRC